MATNRVTGIKFDENRTYGVEIEAFGIPVMVLNEALTRAGIEVRTEYTYHQSVGISAWEIKHDASIRGQHPFELVSPVLKGSKDLEQVKTVCTVLRALGARVNASCGFHVHHGARDMSVTHVRQLLYLYTKMEHSIDMLVSPSRRHDANHYCGSVAAVLESPMRRTRIQEAVHMDDLVHSYNHRGKLNLNHLAMGSVKGTIEFRQHNGTTDFRKVSNWIVFTQALLTRSMIGEVRYSNNGSHAKRNAWYRLGVPLNMERRWQDSDELVRDSITFFCERLKFWLERQANGNNHQEAEQLS